ncbi:MAG TPA: dTDP-4-dehydrorhamnose 3,5-epimerase family protein [Sedimentisphaerales bacterium]|nr:dTDP-4-dehydrorhamnose 3,5-epimerase family protein [Sedimentisphaerales bacterium]
MSKQTLPLKTVFTGEGIAVRGGARLIDGVAVRATKIMPDERGRLGEIMRADDPWFSKFGQVYFTTTYPGVVKAWHYHRKQTDHFYVIRGTIKVALYDARQDSPTRSEVNEVYLTEYRPALLRIPPGVQHGWMCVSDVEAYIVNVVSEVYDYANPDEFRTPPHDNQIPYDWTRKDG